MPNSHAREFRRQFSYVRPQVGAIHAGLECGIIGEKVLGIDMVSYGPTIRVSTSYCCKNSRSCLVLWLASSCRDIAAVYKEGCEGVSRGFATGPVCNDNGDCMLRLTA